MTHAADPDRHAALWSEVRGRVARERGPRAWLRARPTRLRVGLACVAAALVAGVVVLLIPRSDLAAYPVGGLILRLALLAAGLGAVVALFLRTLARSAPRRTAAAVVVLAGLLLPVLLVAFGPGHAEAHAHPESFAGAGTDFVPRALACFLFGVALGAPVLLLLVVLDRSDGLSWPRRLLLAAAVGLVGNLALLLHCPLVGAGHLLAGHATVPLGALLVLALAPRGRTPPA